MLEDFLPLVTKPARYIDNEINAVHKDLSRARTKVCLFFPDTYEVGMSHLGLRILYDILNRRQDTACERVFSPWTDYEAQLRASGRVLTSLESNAPLREFDLVGITLQYELSYTNILAGLDLAGIPLRTAERNDTHPAIIAGGPCSVNPEPLSGFIDAFFIGEAEEAMQEIIELRQRFPQRSEYLAALSRVEGFYVPSLGKKPVLRRFLKNIDSSPYPAKPLVPLMKPIHDRVTVEVARGCIRGCRFCQAGVIYRPYRERSAGRVKQLLHESLRCTGYDELSLASLSSGDYSDIEPLIVDLTRTYRDDRISVSLPSLRVGTLTPNMIKAIAGTRKTGFTLAPEAGTERLRRVINKPVSDKDLLDAAETIFRNGWNTIKLYFMIGLPTETDEDLDGIVRLANELLRVGKGVSKRPVQLNISVSTFVPKPHTPFQWMGQPPIGEIRRRQAYLDRALRRKGISFKPHDPETSVLESAFARGDAAIGNVIAEAVKLGCRFDGWTECFDFAKWERAFAAAGLNLAACATRSFSLDDELPWGHIRTRVTPDFLKKEYRRAEAAEITDNCRTSCEHCGIGCADGGTQELGRPATVPAPSSEPRHSAGPGAHPDASGAVRVRLKYSRTGRVRFLSHLDFMTLVHRALVRARIPIFFSQGFNPHPKIAFGPALSVGMESDGEYLDLDTDPFADLLDLTKRLNAELPRGVRIGEARVVPKKAASLSGSIEKYVYDVEIPADYADGIEKRIEDLLSRAEIIVAKEGKQKNIRPGIEAIFRPGGKDLCTLTITLVDKDQVKPRIQDVIEQLLSITREQATLFRIKRTGLFWNDAGAWKSPMEV